jgi:hypothetical protein
MNDEMKAQQDIQRLSALVRAQQITIDKLEQALAAPVQEPIGYVKLIDTPFGEKLKPVLTIAVPVGSKLYTTPPAAQPAPVQEPVCWKHGDEPKSGCAWCNKQPPAAQPAPARDFTDEEKSALRAWVAAATPTAAQPAPVQPVWIQPDHLQKAQKAPFLCRVEPHKRDDFVPLHTTPPAAAVPDAIHHTDLSEHPQYIEGWNDCRAEMLKGMKP